MEIISKSKHLKQLFMIVRNTDNQYVLLNRSLNSYTNSQTQYNAKQFERKTRKTDENINPYRNLFPWKSLTEFVSVLHDNVIYNDGKLIGVCKPWGVGIHKPETTITNKNAQLLHSVYSGSPKYCVTEALNLLAQKLGLSSRLYIVKAAAERFMSGVILLGTDKNMIDRVNRSIMISKCEQTPHMKYVCITKGWPVFDGPLLRERVGIKMVETDELGDYKEPIIIEANKIKRHMRKQKPFPDGMVMIPVLTEMRILESNKSISASLVELNISSNKFHFIQCYLANKASFVLGDTRYSRRVKNILGVPMSINKAHVSFDESYEPLSTEFSDNLQVRGNNYIPLMSHLKSITLPKFINKETVVIESPILPQYFAWTLDKLGMKNKIYNVSKDTDNQFEDYDQYIKQYM